jgi:hypothetical protein
MVKDQASHQYKTTGKVMMLFITSVFRQEMGIQKVLSSMAADTVHVYSTLDLFVNVPKHMTDPSSLRN